MDFSALIAELRTIASRYNGKDTDRNVTTAMYCEMFRKILQKAENGVTEYGDQIVILWMTLSQLCNTYQTLTACPARDSLYQHMFLLCAKVVLNIKWQQLPDDDQGKANFSQTIANTHQQLVNTGFNRFELLTQLIENPWTDPILSKIMSGDDKEESSGSDTETEETEREKDRKLKEKLDEIATYINKEDPMILKLRVEMLILENCEDFASNLCNCIIKYEQFKDDLDLREMQFVLLHKLNQMEKLQEECEQIVCHTGIKIINRLEQKESNQQLCIRLVQIFLVQDWINPDRNCCTKELLKLWIRHQYMADQDRAKFLENVWSIAKLSSKTEQICLLISGLQKECGAKLRQLYTDLCVYAINIDKGGCEKEMMQGNMDGLKQRQKSMATTCEKLAGIVAMTNLKAAKISALTAFALNPSRANLYLVEKMYINKTINQANHKRKERSSKGKKDMRETHDGDVNLATIYEVERLLNMLRPYYLNPDLQWAELFPVCQKFMAEKGTDIKDCKKEPKEKMSKSLKDGLMQYYCDDTSQYIPAKQSIKGPAGNAPPKSPWTTVSATQSSKQLKKESTKLIPYSKLQNMSLQGNPIDMSKAGSKVLEKPMSKTEPRIKKPRGRPMKNPSFDFAKLLEATKNMPQMQTYTKTSVAQGNLHLPYVPGLTTQEVERAMVQQKKNLSRSISVDQLSGQKQAINTSPQALSGSQSHRTRTLSLERQHSGLFQSGSGYSSNSATDLSKTAHRPRIIPDRSQDKSSSLMSFQDSFASNVNQRSLNNIIQSNQIEVANEVTLSSSTGSRPTTAAATTPMPAPRCRQPSKEELQNIVDWLQTGTEDAKIKPQIVDSPKSDQSTGLVPKQKKQSSNVKSCSNDNMIQYVTFGSSPNQAIQNAQHQQELKIKSGVSKNFASQVMSKFGIKPGMSEEEINIAKIKAIMAQKQLEKEQQQQQQQKQKQKSPKTSSSKGFLLIPGSAQMVMQAKMQGQKTKMLTSKQKQKNGEQSVPKTMAGTSVTNSKTAVKNVSHDGYTYVNQMIQSTKPLSVTTSPAVDLSTQPKYNLATQPISSQAVTVSTAVDGKMSASSKSTKRYREVDIQHALQSLSKVLDKSNSVLTQNQLLQGKTKKEDVSQRPGRPSSSMPSVMSNTTIVVTTQAKSTFLQSSHGQQTTLKASQNLSKKSSGQSSPYQLLYLGQVKTGSLGETGKTVSRAPPTQQLSNSTVIVPSEQCISFPAGSLGSNSANLSSPGTFEIPMQNLNNLQTMSTQNVPLQGLGARTVGIQNVGTQNMVVQGISALPNVQGISAQTLGVNSVNTQNLTVQGINAQTLGIPTMNPQNVMVQGFDAQAIQTISAQNQSVLQGFNAQTLGVQTISAQNQSVLQGFNAQTLGVQTISAQNQSVVQDISAPTFNMQGISNLNTNLQPTPGVVGYQTVNTSSQLFGQNNQGQNIVDLQTITPVSEIISSSNLPHGGISMNIKRIVPNTTVTFTTSTGLMASKVSTPTNILPLSDQNFTSVNNVIVPPTNMSLTQSAITTPVNFVSTNNGNISNILPGGTSTIIGNTPIRNQISTVPSFNLVSTNYATNPFIGQQAGIVFSNSTSAQQNITSDMAILPATMRNIASENFASPSLPVTSVTSNMAIQPVSILPKTATTNNVLVGPFQFVTNTSIINTATASCVSVMNSTGYLIPGTSTQNPGISPNVNPVTILPHVADNNVSVNLAQTSSSVTSNAGQSSMLEAILVKGKNSDTETNKKMQNQTYSWQNAQKNNGLEIVRRVSTSEIQSSIESGQKQENVNSLPQEYQVSVCSHKGQPQEYPQVSVCSHKGQSQEYPQVSVCSHKGQPQEYPQVSVCSHKGQDETNKNISLSTATTLNDNLKLFGNSISDALNPIDNTGFENLLTDTPNSSVVNIVDVHITTCQNNNEGSQLEQLHEGTEVVKFQEGSQLEQSQEGTEVVQSLESNESVQSQEGNEEVKLQEGSQLEQSQGGSQLELSQEGDELIKTHEGSQLEQSQEGNELIKTHEGNQLEQSQESNQHSTINMPFNQGEQTAHKSVSEEKSLSGPVQDNFWKDFSRFKERMASCKLPVTSIQVDDPKGSNEITDTKCKYGKIISEEECTTTKELIRLDNSGDRNSNELNKVTLSSIIEEELRKTMDLPNKQSKVNLSPHHVCEPKGTIDSVLDEPLDQRQTRENSLGDKIPSNSQVEGDKIPSNSQVEGDKIPSNSQVDDIYVEQNTNIFENAHKTLCESQGYNTDQSNIEKSILIPDSEDSVQSNVSVVPSDDLLDEESNNINNEIQGKISTDSDITEKSTDDIRKSGKKLNNAVEISKYMVASKITENGIVESREMEEVDRENIKTEKVIHQQIDNKFLDIADGDAPVVMEIVTCDEVHGDYNELKTKKSFKIVEYSETSDSDEYNNTLQKTKPKEVVNSLTAENLNEDQVEDAFIEVKDVKSDQHLMCNEQPDSNTEQTVNQISTAFGEKNGTEEDEITSDSHNEMKRKDTNQIEKRVPENADLTTTSETASLEVETGVTEHTDSITDEQSESARKSSLHEQTESKNDDESTHENIGDIDPSHRAKHVDLKIAATADSSIEQDELFSDSCENGKKTNSLIDFNVTPSNKTESFEIDDKEETNESIEVKTTEKEDSIVTNQSENQVQIDILSKSDEQIMVERQTIVHTTPKNYENIIESKKQTDDHTPQKNDLMTNYKRLMDEMLSLSCLSENDRFSASKSFGFDEFEKLSGKKQNGTKDTSDESVQFFTANLRKLPKNCISRRHLARSLPDDWAPGQSSKNKFESSFSNEERTLKRSYSDMDLSQSHDSYSDFDTQSVISDRGFQGKSRNEISGSSERLDAKLFTTAECKKLFFTCNNGGEYRLAYPQLAARQKRPKTESCLLSYSEWKSKDNSPEIITQLNVPEPAKSNQVVIEEPKYDFQEKGQEKRCLICQKIFKTMEELRQHVINPCRPPEFRKVITEVKELDLETIYTCTLCNTIAKSEYAAKRHTEVCMQAYKPSDQRNYNMDTIFRCKMCGETFKYQKTACEHVNLHSKVKQSSSPKMSVIDNSESTPVKMENSVKVSEETPLKHKTSPDKSKEKFVWDQVENEGKISELSITQELQIKEMHEDVVTLNSDDVPVDCHGDSINNEVIQEKPVKNSKKDHKVIKEETVKKGKKDKIEIEILLSGETRHTQDNKFKHRKIETEKDIDNESVKSFSTESSYMTIDASETSSIKSGEYKTRSYPPKHSARLISKQIGKRVIKVKKFFGDQFEVPEFVETQVKKANLKRKFKPGNKSGFSISPKLRRALRKRELSNAKKKLKMSRQWNDNGVMKKHVKSSEKKVPLHTMVEDIDNSKHPKVKRENILKVKKYPIENFNNEDCRALFEVLKCQKAGRTVYRCPISACRSSVHGEKAMILHGVNIHKNVPYKTMKNQTFECKYCKEKRSCHDDIIKHSVDHYIKYVVDNIAHCSIKPVMFLSSLIEKKNFKCKTLKAVKSENKSESCSDKSKNNKKSGYESDRKATEKTPEDLCNHGNPKQKFTKTKSENSVELCERKLEINLGKRIKSEEEIKRKPKFSGRKMKIIEAPCNKSNVNKVQKKTPKHLVNEETVVQGLEKYKDTNLKQMNNVQTSELDHASQRRSSRKQSSVEHKHFEESIKQKMVVSSHKKSKDKIVDIKSLSEKMDVSESEESEKTFDSFSSPDSSSLRRSCRKKSDSISAYKDFEMQNKKQSKSVDDDYVVDCDQTQSEKESDVKLERKEEDLEECNRRFSTRSNKRHNINSEVVSRKISNKSNVKRSVVKDRSDESEKLCVHNTRKRNHSLESDTSKTSDVKDITLEDSETGCRRNVKKRHLSLDSNSSKTSVNSEKVNERCKPSSNNKMEKNVKKHKRKSADKEIMENHVPFLKQISLSKSDEIDGLKKSASQRNLRERKTVEPYKVVKKKINAGKKLDSLSKTLHTVNNDIQEAGEESQNAFLDSFKKFVGISKKSITNQIKSLKQGKSSKLRARAIMHRRKQSLRKSKVVNKIKPNDIRTKNNMVEVVDLVEIKDFRNSNKDVSNEASISSEIIDLTEDSESLALEQENGAVKVENDNVKITSTLTNIEEITTSNNKTTSFFDSFLAHVNETESSVSSIVKNNDPSSTKAVKNCTKVEKSKGNLSDENNSTTSGLKKVEKVPDKNLTEQKNKDQLKCSTRKKTEYGSCEHQSKESSETKLELEGRRQNRRSQKKTTITDQEEDKTDVERPKEDDKKNKLGKNKISSKENDHEKKQTEDIKRSKSPDSSFQDSFMSYIDLNDSVPKEETTSLTSDSLKVEAENSLKLARKKSPFKWDLDDDDADVETTTKAIKHSKHNPKYCTEKKSTSQINSNVQTVKVSKSSGSKFSKVSEIISSKNCNQKEKSLRNTRDECKSSDFKIVKRLRNSGHDTSSQNEDTKNAIKVDMDQKGTVMLPIKIQNTDFEKHFVKFLSTSSNKDIDTEGNIVEESQRSVESVILINDGNDQKMSGLEKRQKYTINVNNSDNKEASKASKTGENKNVSMETKTVLSKLDHSQFKSKQTKSVSSTLDKSVLISKQSFKGISASKPDRNRTARYNLPTLQTKKINYSTKSFVYRKTPTDKKLIPISALNSGMNTTAQSHKKVIDESKIKSEETESSLKRNSELDDRIKIQVTNVTEKERDISDKSMFQHKLIPTHRVRHMYHGGKVWQIGQGSVSAMNLASPTRPPHPNSKINTAERVSHVQSDRQEQNETQDSENEHVKDAERNDMSDTSKDGEKHSRWKARKSPPKRPASSDNNVHYGKRTRNTE